MKLLSAISGSKNKEETSYDIYAVKNYGILGYSINFYVGYGLCGFSRRSAEEKKNYAKDGLYVGFTLHNNAIDGDFDGESYLYAPGEIYLIPKVESNHGWGILLGVRGGQGALEISYLWSNHDITWLGAKGEADFKLVNLDFKAFLLPDKPIQPYILFGLCFPWLVVKDGAADGTSVGDASFSGGVGLNIGGGISYYFLPRVSLSGGIVYRWVSYGSIEGVSGINRDIEDPLDGSGVNFSGGLTFTF